MQAPILGTDNDVTPQVRKEQTKGLSILLAWLPVVAPCSNPFKKTAPQSGPYLKGIYVQNETPNEIVILTDHVDNRYSIGCGNCDKTTTHACDNLNEVELHLFGHKYWIDRDESDSVYVLKCAACAEIDVTPFMDDVRTSIDLHERFHDYVKTLTNEEPMYFSAIDQLMYLWDFVDTLHEETEQPLEEFRIDRLAFWMKHVIPVQEVNLQSNNEEA